MPPHRCRPAFGPSPQIVSGPDQELKALWCAVVRSMSEARWRSRQSAQLGMGDAT